MDLRLGLERIVRFYIKVTLFGLLGLLLICVIVDWLLGEEGDL